MEDQGPPLAESAAPPLCSCGAEMLWAECYMIDCDGGWYDEHDYDAINYGPGSFVRCDVCHGEGGYWACGDRERHSRAEPRAAAPDSSPVVGAGTQGVERDYSEDERDRFRHGLHLCSPRCWCRTGQHFTVCTDAAQTEEK